MTDPADAADGQRPAKVLVVDDEPQFRRALSLNLGARGYEVTEAGSGEQAISILADVRPDVVLLDLGLPGLDGLTVIRTLREWTSVPIIVLTARGDEHSKVFALDLGADDYVTKPFGIAELLARIRATTRRVPGPQADQPVIETVDFRIDIAAHRAFAGTPRVEVRLTPTEWAMAIHLARNPDRLVTYRQLVAAVWGDNYQPDLNLLRVHMAHIRHKLEPDAAHPRYFVTDAGMGYRFQTPGDAATT